MSYLFPWSSAVSAPAVVAVPSSEPEFTTAGQPGLLIESQTPVVVSEPENKTIEPPSVQWKGSFYRQATDDSVRRQVLLYFGAQQSASDVEGIVRQLVEDGHASIDCSDIASFTYSGIGSQRHYSDLERLTSYLPSEWTVTLSKSLDILFRSVNQLLTTTQVASTQFVDVDVYQHVRNPHQMIVVHGSYATDRPGRNRVSDLLFGVKEPSATLTAHVRVIALAPSFMKMFKLTPALSLRRLQEAVNRC